MLEALTGEPLASGQSADRPGRASTLMETTEGQGVARDFLHLSDCRKLEPVILGVATRAKALSHGAGWEGGGPEQRPGELFATGNRAHLWEVSPAPVTPITHAQRERVQCATVVTSLTLVSDLQCDQSTWMLVRSPEECEACRDTTAHVSLRTFPHRPQHFPVCPFLSTSLSCFSLSSPSPQLLLPIPSPASLAFM